MHVRGAKMIIYDESHYVLIVLSFLFEGVESVIVV